MMDMENSRSATVQYNYSFDFVRTVSMLAVILFHAAGAYGLMGSTYWPVLDSKNWLGSAIRELFDVFVMPFFLFTAGYFALPSIRNKKLTGFFVNKFNRLYIYWIFLILFFFPNGRYFIFHYDHSNTNYLSYWLHSLLLVKNVSIGPLVFGRYGHMHFWFVSFLFYVLILFGILYKSGSTLLFKKDIPVSDSYRKISIFNVLVFGMLTTLVYYIFIVVFPATSWVIIPLVLQFKTTHLPVLIMFFGFGVYSNYRGWFINNNDSLNLNIWIIASLVLSVLFFITGQDIFINSDISNTLSLLHLLVFSLIRSFLILSYLMVTLTLATKYFSTKKVLLHKTSEVSYEMYLVHLLMIQGFQIFFKHFSIIPVSVKILAVFILGTVTSYFLGKYTLYKFPRISASVFILGFVAMVWLYW